MTKKNTPKTSPEEAGPRIVNAFFKEFLPIVKDEYALLEKAAGGPLQISLEDLQTEVLIFGLHCLDRAVFLHFGAEYRNALMDSAFGFTREMLASNLPEHLRVGYLEHLDGLYNTRQCEYSPMLLHGESLKGTLFWEYAKRICMDAGVYNVGVIPQILRGVFTIFDMMDAVAGTL